MSLFRMLETVDGCVKIDGDNVAKLPLSTHRARLNIIPQVSKVDPSRPGYIYLFGENKEGNSLDSLKILGNVRKFRAA